MPTLTFVKRTTHPSASNKFYILKSSGGRCFGPREGNKKAVNKRCGCCGRYISHVPGSVIQNCVGYVTARWLESQSDTSRGIYATHKFSCGDAKTWWSDARGKYERGQTPKLGSIACWNNGKYGHVAFVEEVYSNTDVLLSESHWSNGRNKGKSNAVGYFGTWRGNPRNYMSGFQGYIYPPVTWGSTPQPDPDEGPNPASPSVNSVPVYKFVDGRWHSNNSYLTIGQMRNNAALVFDNLIERDWSNNAIYALLGNMQQESTINPGLNEKGGGGYGLVQWTPKSNYTNWADQHDYDIKNGDYQCLWIDTMTVSTGQWIQTSAYPISFNDWKTDTAHSLEWLTKAFERNFERSADSAAIIRKRVLYAINWKNFFTTNIIVVQSAGSADKYLSPDLIDYSDPNNDPNTDGIDPVEAKTPGSYHKPNNKHMIIARRPFVY